ncbi:L2EFL protein, partial [Acromyrmex heyeri]
MALVSRSIFRNWWDDIDRYHREMEEHFRRLSLHDDDLWRMPSLIGRFWRERDVFFKNPEHEIGGWATAECDADKYRIVVDVQQFTPEEVTVRTDDKYITIEAKHHGRKDSHGYVSRQFIRRYLLPHGYDISQVKPSLSSDGILTITAPKWKWALPAPGERFVPIIRQTYWPAIKTK